MMDISHFDSNKGVSTDVKLFAKPLKVALVKRISNYFLLPQASLLNVYAMNAMLLKLNTIM